MKINNSTTTSYDCENGYFIDIVEEDSSLSAYIYERNAYFKNLIFRIGKEYMDVKQFTTINENLIEDEIENYKVIKNKIDS